ncbi:MAG: sulfatase [bacterium]|nr:sulfatase [bacterium]
MNTQYNRRTFLARIGMGAAAAAGCARSQATRGPERPNVVFILVDDMGWRDCGFNGSDFYETPNLDRLARDSMNFTNAYAASPVCSPTRAALMTGKHPARIGITDWIPGENRSEKLVTAPNVHQMALEETTLAEAFKAAGYATCHVGKWHLGGEAFYPEHQGFDVNIGGTHAGSPRGGYFHPFSIDTLPPTKPGDHLPAVLTDHALNWLDSVQGTPFFLYLSFYSVHSPVQGRKDLVAKYKEKLKTLPPEDGPEFEPEGGDSRNKTRQDHPAFAAMVEAMDEQVGRVLAKLREEGIEDNTVVVFTSDNGGQSVLHNKRSKPWGSNRPLRAGKGWCYEGGVREPLLVRWPGVTRRGSACSEPVVTMDFYPTLLDMAGLPPRPEQHMDGLSLTTLLRNPRSTLDRDALYWHYPHYHGSGHRPSGAIRRDNWKLIEFFEVMRVELYDLEKDPGEAKDLAAAHPDLAVELREMLHAWRDEVGAKMPEPNPAFEQ